jgi:hypothetical protein
MCAIVPSSANPLAVSVFSAENQSYEAQRKTDDHGPSRRGTRETPRAGLVQVHFGRKGRKATEHKEVHFFREEERARQSFKIFSRSSGSSPHPNSSIAASTSDSFVNARILRIASNRSLSNLRDSALIGRLPRRASSAITSRMSSSLVPFAIAESRNDSGFLLTMQFTSLFMEVRD